MNYMDFMQITWLQYTQKKQVETHTKNTQSIPHKATQP